ncbi:hypothetical protein [Hymenobacter cellulosilyticus]|uniref:Uncharacterized protein n=1 Tax=Hymenobacter cellulosilyticus TaxID=2932248 RepID=A0A8T9Q6S6_9BACT|nr:hypothetical protein [Hymenobacter cellulosilyticus]UOQ70753.1 hypothetical protein MUN79_18930 [Hymenobacter cellulosilyticus]
MPYKILFPLLFVMGLYFLIRSIGRTIALYSQNQIEVDATQASFQLTLPKAGEYEIATKRNQFDGLAPQQVAFTLREKSSGQLLPVRNLLNLMNFKRVNMSGERITAIAEFTAPAATEVELQNPEIEKFQAKDRLIIMPKTGGQGILLIFAMLLSGIATIGGLIASCIFLSR